MTSLFDLAPASTNVDPFTIGGMMPHGDGFGPADVDISTIGGDPARVPVFFVGVHHPDWLAKMHTPAMVSRNALRYGVRKKPWGRSVVTWALDSGAFTELERHGRWTISVEAWADEIRHHAVEIGSLVFASAQDYLCAAPALAATGHDADWHIKATVENYCALIELLDEDDDPYVLPTVQGTTPDEYESCLFAYLDAGVDLCRLPLVGVGTLAGGRRDHLELLSKVAAVAEFGVTYIHAFGVYGTDKLTSLAHRIASADSMAWSVKGRRMAKLATCTHGGGNEANCRAWAEQWAAELVADCTAAVHARHLGLEFVKAHAQACMDNELGLDTAFDDVALAAFFAAIDAGPRRGAAAAPRRERWSVPVVEAPEPSLFDLR